ncbi:PLP-dependent aminotransferase family protein [Deinococcus sp. ME38]|uniref:aminotransferase-like domain-containing protein n=1 Tax=Deinococcus sp. ME38 TaxID=3400344 RepID=UPI003B5CC2E7
MPTPPSPTDAPHWAALLRGWRDHPGPLHTRLHTHLQHAIERGELTPGQRLPAERTLAALLGVSRATTVTALDDLTTSGHLTRHVGRGTHVAPTAPRAQPLLTLRTPVGAAHPSEIDLTIAVPLLTDQQRTRLRDAATHAHYDSPYHPHGLPDLRDLLAQQYTRAGLPTAPDQILITSGAQQAIALTAHTLLRRGDTALLETPTYFGAIDVIRAAGAHLTGTPVGAQHLDPHHFAHQTRTHHPRLAFLTPTHHNPTGTTLPHPARQHLAAHLHDTRLPTLEDDTLLDLPFTDTPPPPRLSTLAPHAPILNVGSLSKLYWAGLRIGWLRLPPTLAPTLKQAKTLTDFGSSQPAQHLALHLLNDLPTLISERRAAITPARDHLAHLLRTHLPDWTFTTPPGGQFLWITLPTPTASAYTHHAARHGLRLYPGASMGVTPLPDQYLRIPFTLHPDHIPEAVNRLARAWAEFTSRGSGRLA